MNPPRASFQFALVEALIRAGDTVLSAEPLFASVWAEHDEPFTNTVQLTISRRLRRKLGEPAAIETITKRRYRIIDAAEAPEHRRSSHGRCQSAAIRIVVRRRTVRRPWRTRVVSV